MKKILFGLLTFAFAAKTFAQNIAVNNDGQAAHSSAMLDVRNPNKGMLIPRVQLTGTNDVTTIVDPIESLLVYNTATNGGGTTTVSPGFYFWNGAVWIRLSASSEAWQVNGNNNTTSAIFFGNDG